MTGFRIRQATPADADDLARVYRSAYQENRELGFPAKAASVEESEVEQWIRDHWVLVAVAAADDAVLGGVRLEPTGPDRVKLSRLGVHEDWKGEGLGSDLVSRAETVVREGGYETIWLTTPGAHPYLPGFYRRRGYVETGEYPLEYRDYDEIIMEKQLE
ncbi:GNAT family N-acetyltransferase [Haloarchaeobius amylolyticus]|uniref:GNAT family N-acetyltransferase n=1 Tax=Haloarchaeobius amylolyticus TaxID=1198296 RepID=UPI00226DB323|nr:GNAT family N-acetyltransferase [Haloarchaeobius amylolyticus]